MKKKGILILSDMFWLVIFILCVAIIYFLLYHPLNKELQDKASISFEKTQVRGDAQYYALLIPQLSTENTASANPSVADLLQFSFAVNKDQLVEPYKTTYHGILDSVFDRKEFLVLDRTRYNSVLQEHRLTQITVYVLFAGKPIDAWSCGYPFHKQNDEKPTCKLANPLSHKSYTNQAEFYTAYKDLFADDGYAELGTATVPSEQGPITIEVVTVYEKVVEKT